MQRAERPFPHRHGHAPRRDPRTASTTPLVPPLAPRQRPSCSGRPAAADPDPAAIRRALDGGADLDRAVAAAIDHRIAPLLWRALDAAGACDELGPRRAVLGCMTDTFRMEAPSSSRGGGAGGASPDRRRIGAGRLQGTRGGRPLPGARAPAHGGHRPPAPPPPSPARAARIGRGGMEGGPSRRRRPLRHRAGPRRGALPRVGAALRAGRNVATRDRPRPGRALGAPACGGRRGDARLRTAARGRARRAGGACRQAASRLRSAGLDRRPRHARRRRRTIAALPSTGHACAPWPRMRAA